MIYLLLFVVLGIYWGYNSKMQGVTLNLGKFMAKDNELAGPNGFQDAITPKSQNLINGLMILAIVFVPIGLFLFDWYLPILGIVLFFVVGGISATFAPKKLFPYIGKIVGSLSRRSADYAKNGDHERSKAAKEVCDMVSDSADELYLVLGKDATVDQLAALVSGTSK